VGDKRDLTEVTVGNKTVERKEKNNTELVSLMTKL
jgi:hypothetical protein